MDSSTAQEIAGKLVSFLAAFQCFLCSFIQCLIKKKEKEKKSMKGNDQGRKPLSHKVVSGAVKLTEYAQKSALVHVSE